MRFQIILIYFAKDEKFLKLRVSFPFFKRCIICCSEVLCIYIFQKKQKMHKSKIFFLMQDQYFKEKCWSINGILSYLEKKSQNQFGLNPRVRRMRRYSSSVIHIIVYLELIQFPSFQLLQKQLKLFE